MKHALALVLLMLPLSPAMAQDEEGGGLGAAIEDGARDMIEGLIDDMRPAIDDLEGLMAEYGPLLELLGEEMGPALMEVFSQVDSIANYEAPVILPNGDIIMRRSADAPDRVPPALRPDAPAEPPAEPDAPAAPPAPGVIDL